VLGECGWSDARLLEQQDTSEAFNFITEALELPLLSLKVDLFHHGKSDESDHKVIHERLLNLAVPPDVDGKGVKLEDCLEEYFNAQVDVLRDSLEDKAGLVESPQTATSPPARSGDTTIVSQSPLSQDISDDITVPDTPPGPLDNIVRLVSGDDGASVASSTTVQESACASILPRRASSARDEKSQATSSMPSPPPRQRSSTVIQRVLIDKNGRASSEPILSNTLRGQGMGSVVVKALTIPAWQFFRLMRMFNCYCTSSPMCTPMRG
jgi:hypothetical protein